MTGGREDSTTLDRIFDADAGSISIISRGDNIVQVGLNDPGAGED